MNRNLENYIRQSLPELHHLIRDLCAIPAPSHHEEKRAEFCREWFEKNCGGDVSIDDALNVIWTYDLDKHDDVVVFMAHTDTVFPDLEPMPFSEHDGKMFCPGVTDDTANLAVLMICARWFIRNRIPAKTGILFVANSCEEGLGNLKGSRKIVETYGKHMRALITLDGTHLQAVVTKAVGSHRYRVTVRTEGGHSFSHFGNKNAIHYLADMIQTLYRVRVPVDGDSKTTYNVGTISGGTSVNTIAQEAEMLYEYRSDSLACLRAMEDMFFKVIDHYRSLGVEVSVEKIGDRPCAGDVNPAAQSALIENISRSIRETLNKEAVFSSGSTDANTGLAAGIPSACISVCYGGKCHTREEWLDVESLQDGCRLFMHLLCSYFDI